MLIVINTSFLSFALVLIIVLIQLFQRKNNRVRCTK